MQLCLERQTLKTSLGATMLSLMPASPQSVFLGGICFVQSPILIQEAHFLKVSSAQEKRHSSAKLALNGVLSGATTRAAGRDPSVERTAVTLETRRPQRRPARHRTLFSDKSKAKHSCSFAVLCGKAQLPKHTMFETYITWTASTHKNASGTLCHQITPL